MTIRPIHLLGSSPLRERAQEVGKVVDDEVRQLVRDLFDTMHAAKGVGLAANQIGVTRRVAVVQAGEQSEPLVLIDPVIVERQDEATDEEGCLSIPDIYAEVTRPARVVVETTTLEGARVRVEAGELKARAIQHEIDHLDGILFLDRLSPLKRRLLLRKWKTLRKGQTGLLREVPEAATQP
ncbi:MAG: peptide deformylase [Gemmatimonadetes bacterium]|nr:peptide deformylase [Gemmatimonadota bacterium]